MSVYLRRIVFSFAIRHRYHIFAVAVFLILTTTTLREFLFDDSLFIYRDLTWSNNLDAMIDNMWSTLDLESSRRIVFLGPLFYGSQILGLDGIAAEKILFFASGSAIGIIAYFAIFKFLESKVGAEKKRRTTTIFIIALFGAFLYSFNPIVTSQLSTTLFFVVSYSLLPLIFYYFDRTLTEGKFKNVFITGILISLALAGTTQFLALLPIFVLVPWVLLVCIRERTWRSIGRVLVRTSYVFLATAGLSFYWIFISFMIMSQGVVLQPPYILTLDSLRLFSSENSMVNVIRLMGDWWPRVPMTPIIHEEFWTALTFVIPVASVLFLIRAKGSRLGYYIVALSMMSLFAIFFYKGSQPPLEDFYVSTYSLPVIGWMFRIPQKIGMMLPLFVTMIISIGMYELLAARGRKVLQGMKYAAIAGLVITASIVNWPLFTGDYAGVYQSSGGTTSDTASFTQETVDVSASGSMVLMFGESRKHELLSQMGSLEDRRASAALADRELGFDRRFESSSVAALDDKRENLLLHFLPDDAIMVKPFDATDRHSPGEVWSRAGTHNPLHGPFNNYLTAVYGISNSDHDYGMGVILTWGNDRIDIPVSVERTDSYDLFIRLFENEAGGPIRIYLDGTLIREVDTQDSSKNRFSVLNIGSQEIEAGTHTVTLENVSGLNAVNVLSLVPSSKVGEADARLREYVQGVTNLYLYDAERDFQSLETGWQNHHPNVLTMSVDGEGGVGAGSPTSAATGLTVDVMRGESTSWNVISGGFVPVEPSSVIRYEFTVHGRDVNGLHAKVYYYDADREPFANEFVMGGMSDTFTHSVSKTLLTPEGAQYARLEFWTRTNPAQEGSYTVENVVLIAAGVNSSQARIGMDHGSLLVKSVDILKESQYTMLTRAQFCSDCGSITASIGNESRTFSLRSENEQSEWLAISAFLPAQETGLQIAYTGKAQIDTVALYSDSDRVASIDQLLLGTSAPAILEYEKAGPVKYVITAESDGPFVLELLETYHPLWTAVVGGQESYSPVQMFGGHNGFLIDRGGVLQIEIEYLPQQWFYIGGGASLVFFLASLLYLIRPWKRLSRQSFSAIIGPAVLDDMKRRIIHTRNGRVIRRIMFWSEEGGGRRREGEGSR